jgi:hypothetical protein
LAKKPVAILDVLELTWLWLYDIVLAGSYDTLSSDILATLLGGMLLTLLFFLVREKLSPLPRLSGVWDVTTTTKTATLPQYAHMVITYRVILLQSGRDMTGTAEKVGENVGGVGHTYKGELRVRSVLSGGIEKFYFSRSRVQIHMVESGRKRESTTFFQLSIDKKNQMSGVWDSTAADSSGVTSWVKSAS